MESGAHLVLALVEQAKVTVHRHLSRWTRRTCSNNITNTISSGELFSQRRRVPTWGPAALRTLGRVRRCPSGNSRFSCNASGVALRTNVTLKIFVVFVFFALVSQSHSLSVHVLQHLKLCFFFCFFSNSQVSETVIFICDLI